MTMRPIVSSMLQAVGEDGDNLLVQFNNGKVYRYIGAAEHLDAMIASESAGRYLNATIKPQYTAELVE